MRVSKYKDSEQIHILTTITEHLLDTNTVFMETWSQIAHEWYEPSNVQEDKSQRSSFSSTCSAKNKSHNNSWAYEQI